MKFSGGEKIQVLLTLNAVSRIFFDPAGAYIPALEIEEASFTEILQSVARCVLDEIGEIGGEVRRHEFVMEQRPGIIVEHALHLILDERQHRLGVDIAGGEQHLKKLARSFDALLSAGNIADMEQHHVAKHLADAASGKGVEANEDDAARREVTMRDRHQPVAHRFGNPRIEAVRDDVIELSKRGTEVHDIGHIEPDIFETEIANLFASKRDGLYGEVESGEGAVRKHERHRNQVSPVAGAEFKDAAAAGGWGVDAVQRRESREALRVCGCVGESEVQHLIVGVWRRLVALTIWHMSRGAGGGYGRQGRKSDPCSTISTELSCA